MYKIRICMVFILVTAAVAACPGMATAAETQAALLVSLVKPHEREAQAIRFMLTVAPIGFPEGLAECMVAKATPLYNEYFAALYAKRLNEPELRQAVEFFQSETGRAAVTIQLQHEQDLLDAAARGQQIGNEKPEYPLPVRKALEKFGSMPAGRHFVEDGPALLHPSDNEITDIRNSAMAQCLAGPALGGRK